MGLILCDAKSVSNPFYVKELGINIYSLEELCYLIVNYPFISLDNFADGKLVDFVTGELRLPVHGDSNDEIIISILYCSDYYSYKEIDEFKEKISDLRKLSGFEFISKKADFLFRLKMYGKAEYYYKTALKESELQKTDSDFIAQLWKKIGCCRANMFRTDAAYDAFRNSYEQKSDDSILRYIYFLSKEQSNITRKQEFLQFLDDRVDDSWDKEYENMVSSASHCKEIDKLEKLLDTDLIRRRKVLENEVKNLKTDYRNML
ncbi:MAG: hypothetical protein Q4E54_01595 [Lachnospiraceae bacterium]|nr:hypothetical protein [Lachnospiraceae bacterium]